MSLNVNPDRLAGNHDVSLSAWGPYSKKLAGVSHIPDHSAGVRFDLSVFPGIYRRKVCVPSVLWESDFHPWNASADLSFYTYRHDLVWKDQVYCDVDYCRLDEQRVMIRSTLVNNTDNPENLVLHYAGFINHPDMYGCRVILPEGGTWVDGMDYRKVRFGVIGPRDGLQYDGRLRGEKADNNCVDGKAFGDGFGTTPDDTVEYSLSGTGEGRIILFRFKAELDIELCLNGDINRSFSIPGSSGMHSLRLESPNREQVTLRIRVNRPGLVIDGFAVVPTSSEAELAFAERSTQKEPEITVDLQNSQVILKYEDVNAYYGIKWDTDQSRVRQYFCGELERTMKYRVHNHPPSVIRESGDEHYTDIFLNPIFVEPGQKQVHYAIICTAGTAEEVNRLLSETNPESRSSGETFETAEKSTILKRVKESPYAFSQRLMGTTVLTNVVYPIRTRGHWIRHYTPGKWWNSLYTWDSGFIGLGAVEMNPDLAVDILNAYVTEPGEPGAAFIHHGSPVPVQHYLLQEIFNRTQSRELLEFFYPRLQQYHRFLAGRYGGSTTANLKSGLLRTWDYFYNSGGWDDYPPQKAVHEQHLEHAVTPVANTAHAIRTAKILKQVSEIIGYDSSEYDKDIKNFSDSILENCWDEKSGYFSYAVHDEAGEVKEHLRDKSGANFNMGLDGVTPLLAGICTEQQEKRLVDALIDDKKLWCRCGLSTVDQSAPYYRKDGYWNGAVWMPHQWFMWKALLDSGHAEEARRIAFKGLEIWKNEVDTSYNCFEHFIVETGRGAGWHHFGGLSTPVLSWYNAYYAEGRLTVGFDAWITEQKAADDASAIRANISFTGTRSPAVIASLKPALDYSVSWNGNSIPYTECLPGTLEIEIPETPGFGELHIV